MTVVADVFRIAIREPTSIDPYRAQEIEGIFITKQLFVGLAGIDQRHRPTPGVALSWDTDSTGTVWTFRLRRDVRFSNGEPVDSASFIRGITRALDPAAGSETAYHASAVRGYDALRAGATTSLSGLRAPDPWTLVFELDRVDFEFDVKVVQPIFSPVPRCAGPAGNEEFNRQPIGNGPYAMVGPWRRGERMVLHRNPHWFGPAPAVSRLEIDILDGPAALADEYAGFAAGRYDYARIPAGRVAGARSTAPGFVERDLPGLYYLIPFCHRPPMDNVWARRAVSLAIDRQSIATEILHRTRTPATSLISPWFTEVHDPQAGYPYVAFDPELARACAARSPLRSTGVDLAHDVGLGHEAWARAVADNLRTHLGIEVRTLAMSTRELVQHRTSGTASGLCRAGWAYDHPTPDSLLYPLLHSSCTAPDGDGRAHGDNEGRYANAEFDSAVDAARAEPDPARRVALWRTAERIALRDVALIPLWYRTEYRVFAADRFADVDIDFFGNPTLTAPRAQVPAGVTASTTTGGGT